MKIKWAHLLFFITYWFSVNQTFSQTPNSWTQKNALGFNQENSPSARWGAVGFSIDGKGYVGTGYDGKYRKDFWQYDPATNTWTQKADLGETGRAQAVSFVIDSKGYVGTGNDDNVTMDDFWQYDPVLNTWTQKSDYPGGGRTNAAGFSIGQKGYVGTGSNGSSYEKDFWEYDPSTDSWTQKTDVNSKRVRAVGFSINNKGYLCTGCLSGGETPDLLEYDPALNTWVKKKAYPGSILCGNTGFSIGSKGYVGISNFDFWEYDQASNTWSQKANFPGIKRNNVFAMSIGDKGYAGLGITAEGVFQNDFWEFDPATNSWNEKAKFGGPGRYYASGFSIQDKGYVTGGYSGGDFTNDLWEFDPSTNIWTQRADFPGTPRQAAVGFNIGNKGYIGTGNGATVWVMNDFWEYDPQTNTWAQKANFPGTPRNSAVGLGIGNKGYIGTGYDGTDDKKDFWEYNPETDTWTQKANFGGQARELATAFCIGNKGYLGLGSFNKKDLWEYDPQTNIWTKKADFPQPSVGSSAFAISDKGYVTYVDNIAPYQTDLYQFDAVANSWTQKASIPGNELSNSVGFAINNKGYIGTGVGNILYTSDFWEYTPDLLTTGIINGTLFCPLTTIQVPFSVATTFNPGNVFTAQLSDANGSFASPVYIGTLSGTSGGTILATIPSSTTAGAGYRIRVVSSDPVLIGTDNGTNLSVQTAFVFYQDADGDGFGNPANALVSCTPQNGYVSDSTDCNDNNAAVNPAAPEITNGIDDNCNNEIDENTCLTPGGLYVSDIASQSVVLHWNSVTAKKIKARIKKSGVQNPWMTITTSASNTSVTALNLQPSTNYQWQLRAICNAPYKSPWSSSAFFTTLPLKVSETGLNPLRQSSELILYPNPANGEFNVSLVIGEDDGGEATLQVLNILGAITLEKKISIENGTWNDRIKMPDSASPGVYWVIIRKEGQQFVKKIIVE